MDVDSFVIRMSGSAKVEFATCSRTSFWFFFCSIDYDYFPGCINIINGWYFSLNDQSDFSCEWMISDFWWLKNFNFRSRAKPAFQINRTKSKLKLQWIIFLFIFTFVPFPYALNYIPTRLFKMAKKLVRETRYQLYILIWKGKSIFTPETQNFPIFSPKSAH